MCENNERYDYKTTRWIQKTMQCMWILNINDAWKKFGQILKNWKFLVLIDRKPIGSADSNQKFLIAILIDRETDSIDQKSRKKDIFENKAILCRKLLKALCFMNEMHEYEIKSFSKTLEFNPDLPKTRFFNQFVLKTQTLNTFCIKIKEHIILDSHNKITHNIMYQV